jgi:hypothetical protein
MCAPRVPQAALGVVRRSRAQPLAVVCGPVPQRPCWTATAEIVVDGSGGLRIFYVRHAIAETVRTTLGRQRLIESVA